MTQLSQLTAAQLHEAIEISARNVERAKQKGMPAMAVRFICAGRALTTELTLRRHGLYLAEDVRAGIMEAQAYWAGRTEGLVSI